ncbi:MAG: sigma-54-dependent Fis family transcriptional regulator [Ignavibacteriae bacterium]|nr:MAG: sigma-54-dependent Fis family transcriptional regulator [Ignavibacteriota bacterium]
MNILIIDDEQAQRMILSGNLKKKGHYIIEASSGDEGIEKAVKNDIDIVITDFKMPGKNGIEVLKAIITLKPEIAVVIVTAFGTIEDAVCAMKEGAYDYITKPIDLNELDNLIKRISERQQLISENKLLKEKLGEKYSIGSIITRSKKMGEMLSVASRIAESKASVLITGESGTGKELLANAIHFASERKNKPFIVVNCAALNDNLLESELFGHEKGAFTGADRKRIGRFEAANGGTMFLDEIGDLPLSTQIKLLRVLQEEKFERVGSSEQIKVDIRIITATNKDLEDLIKEEKFREDLYFRLNVVSIHIPALRERKEDIIPLAEFFINKYNKESKVNINSLSKEAAEKLYKYNYPGNVRELENIIYRAVVLSRNEIITSEDIFINIGAEGDDEININSFDLSGQVEKLEKKLVIQALEQSNNNQSAAARMLGISERNLRYRLNKWGMK